MQSAIGRDPLFAQITHHASLRMGARRLNATATQAALAYGRIARVRGAEIHAIGRNEVARYRIHGIDLRPYEGVQVVCSPEGAILTLYRNRDFRGLRPGGRRRRLA